MKFDWGVFFTYVSPITVFTDPLLSLGLAYTIIIAIGGQIGSTIFGLIGAAGRMSRFRVFRAIALIYITYFRGTPIIVQLSLVFFGAAALGIYGFPDLYILGFPVPGAVQAGLVTISLCDGAYMTEIIRAGILSVDKGQVEAGKALGLRRRAISFWIVAPQAARIIVPPYGNHFNSVIKSTSIVITIGGLELFGAYSQRNANLFHPFELFLACSFYYLALTIIWTAISSRIEKHFDLDTPIPERVRRNGLRALIASTARDATPVDAALTRLELEGALK